MGQNPPFHEARVRYNVWSTFYSITLSKNQCTLAPVLSYRYFLKLQLLLHSKLRIWAFSLFWPKKEYFVAKIIFLLVSSFLCWCCIVLRKSNFTFIFPYHQKYDTLAKLTFSLTAFTAQAAQIIYIIHVLKCGLSTNWIQNWDSLHSFYIMLYVSIVVRLRF